MAEILRSNNYGFLKHTKFFIIPEKSLFLVKAPLGFRIIKLPSYYFYKSLSMPYSVSFLFVKKQPFVSFLRHLSHFYQGLLRLFFVRLRFLGLGYKFKRIGACLFRFYFTMEMYTYFHVPKNIICRSRKNRILLLSNDLAILKSVLAQILLLRKAGGYTRRGLWYARTLLFLRKRKKI